MKTEEQIFNTEEEAFKAVDAYVKQECILFSEYCAKTGRKFIGNVWHPIFRGGEHKFTEELYSLYLQSKNK